MQHFIGEKENYAVFIYALYIIYAREFFRRGARIAACIAKPRKSESIEVAVIRFMRVYVVFHMRRDAIFPRRSTHKFFKILIEVNITFVSGLQPYFVDRKLGRRK